MVSFSAYPVKHATTNNTVRYNAGMTNSIISSAHILAVWTRIREAHGDVGLPLTQTAVAKTCGITQPSVQRWAAGENLPTLKQAIRFCLKTGVCVEWLYTERGAKHPIAKPGSTTEAVLQIFHALDEDGKKEVLRHAEYIASRNSGRLAH